MYVIGTAGHVDHGKSSLVEALTGIDPDRLKEEKDRAMTIDLGFAWLRPEGNEDEIGIVDVPGHRDFIENMLAGVGGIDLALLVIAADEGIMPQTKEHLAILDLLQVRDSIVALTKVDLVDDPDWLELVILDIHETLHSTRFQGVPIVPVSAVSGQGIKDLTATIIKRMLVLPTRMDEGKPRLPIDRIFSLTGFGTVVTGTLTGGSLRLGDGIEIQPAGLKGRIRGLQTHKTKLEIAQPGSRVAINLTGIEKEEIKRGDVLTASGVVRGTLLCDVEYQHLPDALLPLKHNTEVKLFVGSAEVIARTRVLGAKMIAPGEQGWLQLVLREPLAIARGDRFILRQPSPGVTIGGGRILDAHPGRQHRRFKPQVIDHLNTLAKGTPAELMLNALKASEPILSQRLFAKVGFGSGSFEATWAELTHKGQARLVNDYAISTHGYQKMVKSLTEKISNYHRENPLRPGIMREELRSRLNLKPQFFSGLIEDAIQNGLINATGKTVNMPEHSVTFSSQQQQTIQRVKDHFERTGINSPSVKETKSALGEDVYYAMLDLGHLVQVNDEVVYLRSDYEKFVQQIRHFIYQKGAADTGQIRDELNTSRKYAIALLEHLDDIKVTKRAGDKRILVN